VASGDIGRRASEAGGKGPKPLVLDSSLECSGNISLVVRSEGVGATLDGQGRSRLFSLSGGCSLTLQGLTLVNGYSKEDGGAIRGSGAGSLKLADTSIKDSESEGFGGGIAMTDSGDVELHKSTTSGCSARRDGGGISIRQGGALALTESSVAQCSVEGSGGGIALADSGDLSLIDSAVSNSTAAKRGGGIQFESSGSIATFLRSTLSDNQAASASALYYGGSTSTQGSVDDSRFVGNIAENAVTITAATEMRFHPCALGEFMPVRGEFNGDVRGCNVCPERYFGNATDLETAACSGICPLGHFCEEGSALPVPCPAGTSMPLLGASRREDCLTCPRGQHQPDGGQPRCTACPDGTYSADTGQSYCEECEPGGYCEVVDGSMVRQACPAGSYNPETRSTSIESCLLCPNGTSSSDTGATTDSTCVPCRAGSFASGEGNEACKRCPQGFYQSATGATSCLRCAAGKFCPAGASLELPATCDPGTYANMTDDDGIPDCFDCPVGSSCGGGGAPPLACSPGAFANTTGLSECFRCAGGSYQSEANAMGCLPCDKGSYCEPGASRPLPCEGGSYSDKMGLSAASQCTPADLGHFATTGSTEQKPCAKGSFAATSGLAECASCDPGTSSGTGSDSCSECAVGSYAANPGQGECTRCPHPLSSGSGGVTCSICKEGYYLLSTSVDPNDIWMAPTEHCKPCPPNAFCPTNTTLETLVVPQGYWRASSSSAALTECRSFGGDGEAGKTRCAGSELDAGDASRRRMIEEVSPSDEYCAPGFYGPECRLCVADKHHLVDGDTCRDCLPLGSVVGRIAGAVLCVFVACGIAAWAYSKKGWRKKPGYIGRILRLVDRAVVFYVGMGFTPKLKILLGFYQVCIVLTTTYSARLPIEYTSWTDKLAEAISIDWTGFLLPAQCLPFQSRLLAVTITPASLIALLLLTGDLPAPSPARPPAHPPRTPACPHARTHGGLTPFPIGRYRAADPPQASSRSGAAQRITGTKRNRKRCGGGGGGGCVGGDGDHIGDKRHERRRVEGVRVGDTLVCGGGPRPPRFHAGSAHSHLLLRHFRQRLHLPCVVVPGSESHTSRGLCRSTLFPQSSQRVARRPTPSLRPASRSKRSSTCGRTRALSAAPTSTSPSRTSPSSSSFSGRLARWSCTRCSSPPATSL